MSHAATNWAIKQRGLKPITKIVLWHLADCHNPSHGCFPSQKYLAEQCEISERSVRTHLSMLESYGLIVREAGRGGTGTFDRTEYTLCLEVVYTPPEKSADGKNASPPPADSGTNQRQILPPNPVREPCKGTSKREKKHSHQLRYSFDDDWSPGLQDVAWAKKEGLSQAEINFETKKLINADHGKSWPCLSQRWRDWILKAVAFKANRNSTSPDPRTEALLRRARARQQ